jgi:benzoate/toluate 1,2-dioxygenase subunit beta
MARAKKRAASPARKKAPAKRRPLKAAPARRTTAKAAANGDLLRDVEQFLYRQAALLDGRRWAEFIDLFDRDGVYWVPASPEQTTGDGVPSIFYEDRDLMRVRMKRVGHPHAWSQAPDWGTNHVVGNVMIDSANPKTGDIVVHSRFHMMEFRRDASRHFAGSYIHHLRRTGDGFRIKLQRVDMVNGQGPYDYVLQIWV